MQSANSTIPCGSLSACLLNWAAIIFKRSGRSEKARFATDCELPVRSCTSFMMIVSARTAIFLARRSFVAATSALSSISHLQARQQGANRGFSVAISSLSGLSLGMTRLRKINGSAQCPSPGQRAREKSMSL